jgi:hypothetical protein
MSNDSRNGSPWAPEEIAQLRKLADEGLNAAAIASKMWRTGAGTVKKAVAERLSLNPAKHRSR